MKMLQLALLIGMGVLLSATFLGCEEDIPPLDPVDYVVPYDENAMLMDLYLSDQLVPSEQYHDRIVKDMGQFAALIDTAHHHILEQKFYFPFEHDKLLLGFDDTTRVKVDAGEYHAWDSLNAEYHVEEITAHYTWHHLEFACCLHMLYLKPVYEVLPGLESVSLSLTNVRASNVFPGASGDTLSYFFIKGGDCNFDFCAYYEFLYCRSVNLNAEVMGYWKSDSGTEEPAWFVEAYKNYYEYWDRFPW